MNVIHIDDPDDPRISAYRDIRERDLVGRHGRFVCEGKIVLQILLSTARFPAESVLVLENRLAGLTTTLQGADESLPVYVASQPVMDRIVGFHIHRGVLAIGLPGAAKPPEEVLAGLSARAVVLVLVGISNHDNVGAIFRNAAAFGADFVLLDRTCCDPLYRKSTRVSVGATLKVPFGFADEAAAIPDLMAAHGFEQLALSPQGSLEIGECRRADRLALWFGSEGEGLPQALMSRLTTVRIAMAAGFDSLNVAAASAIALHRLGARG